NHDGHSYWSKTSQDSKPHAHTLLGIIDFYNSVLLIQFNTACDVPRTTSNADGTSTSTIPGPVTTEEKAQKKNDVKARSITPVSTVSTYDNTTNLSDATVYAFLANQPNGSELMHENLEQIHEDDLEEIDLKWQLALLSMRARRYFQRTGNAKVLGTKKAGQGIKTAQERLNVEDASSKAMVAIDGAGYNVVTPPPTCLFVPPTIDLSNSSIEECQHPEFQGYGPKDSKSVCVDTLNEIKKALDAPIIKDWVSSSDEDESEMVQKPVLKNMEKGTGQREFRPVWNNTMRINHQNFSNSKKNFASTAVLTKSEIVPISTARHSSSRAAALVSAARPINTDAPKPLGNRVTSAVGKQGINAVKSSACWVWRSKIKETYPNSLTSRSMMEGMLHLRDELKVMCDKKNSVLFIDTECFVLSPNFKLADESQVLLKVSRKNNMFSFDMKNIVPQKDLTCLLAKAINDESMLWHRRLGYINFKNINKLVKDNLVRGLPSKRFENDQTCVACLKGKQHKVSFKSKIHNSISQPLFMLHIDLFGPTFVQTLMIFQVKDTKTINSAGPSINTANASDNTGSLNINTVSPPVNTATLTYVDYPIDPPMPELEDTRIFDDTYDDRDEGAEADYNNLETIISVSTIPSTRVHKDHPKEQIIGDVHSAVQTRKMAKQNKAWLLTFINKQKRTNHKDFQNYLFASFHSQIEPKKVTQALDDESWVEVMQEKLLQFKLLNVWTLVDLPCGKRAIGTKWVFRNKRDHRGIVVRNKARLVAQGHRQEEGIDYDEVFAPVARIKEIRLFLAYASFMDFIVYQMDVKSTFIYYTVKEEVYVSQPPGFLDPEFPNRVYKVEKALYGLHQAPRAWLDIMFAVCACSRFQVQPKVSHMHAVKRIFRYLKGQPTLGLWYPKDSPLELIVDFDSDYAGSSLDRKSITGGLKLKGRLINDGCADLVKMLNTTSSKTINSVKQIHAIVDGKAVVISESSVRSDLLFDDEDDTVSPTPHDSPLTGDYTPRSDKGSTKAIYHKAFITLTKRVKKLETQLKQKRSRAVIYSSDEEEPSLDVDDFPKQGRMIGEIDKDENINLVSEQAEVHETAKPLKDDDDATLAETLLNIKRSTTKDKGKGGYKQSYFKGMKYEDIRPIFERKLDEQTEEDVKAQADTDQEIEEMKLYVKIVHDEDIAIDDIPLATKPPVIVEYKIVKEGKISTYHIIRADGSTKRYTSMIKLLDNIDREDLETLWKLVKDKHRNTRPEEDYERVLWGDIIVMFEPDIESEVSRQLQGYDVMAWKLFSSSGVHFVRFKNMHIFMLVDKIYPLTPTTITKMLERKLQADQ
nr:putative ribonuclease H-like domain-containing protein [Tanacetum cinerariifolium]